MSKSRYSLKLKTLRWAEFNILGFVTNEKGKEQEIDDCFGDKSSIHWLHDRKMVLRKRDEKQLKPLSPILTIILESNALSTRLHGYPTI